MNALNTLKPLGKVIAQSPTDDVARRMKTAAALVPNERVAKCGRVLAPLVKGVGVMREGGRMWYSNLVRCNSPWSCPACAPAREEQDYREISATIDRAMMFDLNTQVITYTIAHDRRDKLKQLHTGISDTYQSCNSGDWSTRFSEQHGFNSKLKKWEVVYTGNGWHVHLHVLAISEKPIQGEAAAALSRRWSEALKRRGLSAGEHGILITRADAGAATYLTAAKEGRADSMTPFELLDVARGDDAAIERFGRIVGSADRDYLINKAGALYREYCAAMKGVARFYWSDFGRDDYGIAEARKRTTVPNPEKAKRIAYIPRAEWKKVIAHPIYRDLRRELLEIAERDPGRLREWLTERGINAVF